jgi:hypothetical protein
MGRGTVMPERDLQTLIRKMSPALQPETYVFLHIASGEPVSGGVAPIMMFREPEGLTLVVPREQAETAGLSGSFPSRLITLYVASALEAVGFLAAVTARLAAAGIAVNPVSAFHHDHLFVPAERAEEALAILRAIEEG